MQERESLLKEYKGLLANLEEAFDLKRSNEADQEVDDLIDETKAELRTVVASLNASEVIEVTKDVTKVVDADGNTVILYSKVAPYEVHFDNAMWYSCVITDVVQPETALERLRYKAWILGYNVEEETYSEQLRVWQPQAAEGETTLRSGVACHAVNPRSGRFEPAKVVRLTLSDTVIVTFSDVVEMTKEVGETDGAGAAGELATGKRDPSGGDTSAVTEEVPLSHMRVGRFYQQLRKRSTLTSEERARRRAQNVERKRVRRETKRLTTTGYSHVWPLSAPAFPQRARRIGSSVAVGLLAGCQHKRRDKYGCTHFYT